MKPLKWRATWALIGLLAGLAIGHLPNLHIPYLP